VAGGSCQEMGPAVDFFLHLGGGVLRGAGAETKLAGPKRPFLPPTGGTVTATRQVSRHGSRLLGASSTVLPSREWGTEPPDARGHGD
jgi:hypothetical protein